MNWRVDLDRAKRQLQLLRRTPGRTKDKGLKQALDRDQELLIQALMAEVICLRHELKKGSSWSYLRS